ncbi:MAG: hypothetical protein ACK55I_45290, partial [bacterium]
VEQRPGRLGIVLALQVAEEGRAGAVGALVFVGDDAGDAAHRAPVTLGDPQAPPRLRPEGIGRAEHARHLEAQRQHARGLGARDAHHDPPEAVQVPGGVSEFADLDG